MLYQDQNEPMSIYGYLAQCIPVERVLLNKPANPPRPDYGFLDWEGKWYGVSRKQSGELMGDIDGMESQLLEEMQGCDYMALLWEGLILPAEDGGAWILKQSAKTPSLWFQNRHYSQSWKGVRQKLASLHDKGVLILQTASELDTAGALVALYNEAQRPEGERRTLSRLTKERYYVSEVEQVRRDFMIACMSIPQGGWSEETADAAATWMQEREAPLTLVALIHCLREWPDELAKGLMRSASREGARQVHIGPAKVQSMRRALGVS